MSEADLVQNILVEFGALPTCRIFRQNVGAAKRPTGGLVRFGTPGQADIFGILAPTGRFFAIEAKTPTGRQSEDQKRWQKMVERFGGAYAVVRSMDEARRFMSAIGAA